MDRTVRVADCPLTRAAGTVSTYLPWALVSTVRPSSPIPTAAPTSGCPLFSEVTLPRKVALCARAGAVNAALNPSAASPVRTVRRNEKPIILGFLDEEWDKRLAAGKAFRLGTRVLPSVSFEASSCASHAMRSVGLSACQAMRSAARKARAVSVCYSLPEHVKRNDTRGGRALAVGSCVLQLGQVQDSV